MRALLLSVVLLYGASAAPDPPELPGNVADTSYAVLGDTAVVFPGPSCADDRQHDIGRCHYEWSTSSGAKAWTVKLDNASINTEHAVGCQGDRCPSSLDYIGTVSVANRHHRVYSLPDTRIGIHTSLARK